MRAIALASSDGSSKQEALYRRMEPNMQLIEYRCLEFVEEFLYGNLRKRELVKHWEGDAIAIDITRKIPHKFYEWFRK